MRLRDLMHVLPRLTFERAVDLHDAGTIELPGGVVTNEDLTKILRESNLSCFERASVGLWHHLTGTIEHPELLEKGTDHWYRAVEGVRPEKADSYVLNRLAETYLLIATDDNEEKMLSAAAACRSIIATRSDTARNGPRMYSRNTLTLAHLERLLNHPVAAQRHLDAAQRKLTQLLENIRNDEARQRAEENAQLGITHYLDHLILGDRKALQTARSLMQSYRQYDPKGRYLACTQEIIGQ